VADPVRLCSYFTRTAGGPLIPGAQVEWSWGETEKETVHVHEVLPERRIRFRWPAWKVEEMTEVCLTFEPEGAGTVVTVAEQGWKADQAGLESSYEHCAGWQHMLLCLRARLIHGIDLR
jgi:uncharacterized protein YndB with AHSA1/START domain